MGTRANIKFKSNGETIMSVYHLYDGYPEYVGIKLAKFVNKIKNHNGLIGGEELFSDSNGIHCMALQYIAKFKNKVGSFYAGELNYCDYEYTINENDLNIEFYMNGKRKNIEKFIKKYDKNEIKEVE